MNIYATVRSYEAMVAAIKRRAAERNLSYAAIDRLANLSSGYMGKACGPSQTKRFGWLSTFAVVWALGLAVAFVEDEAATAATADIELPRQAGSARPGNYAKPLGIRIKRRFTRLLGRSGGRRRMQKLSVAERSRLARRAAAIRWGRRDRARRAALARWGGKE